MPTLTLLVILLLVLVTLLLAAALVYTAHRYPAIAPPLLVASGWVMVMVSAAGVVVSR
jgi:hypothetical protein